MVLDVASTDTTEGTVDTDAVTNGAQSTLTFTATSWNTPQTVTLTGVNDADADGSRDYTVTLTVNTVGTADDTYDTLPAVTVYAVNAAADATPDVNGDGAVDTRDVLVMYYTYTSSSLLTDPTVGERLRRLVFQSLRGSRPDTNATYMAMLTAADDWKRAPDGDVNADGAVDTKDVLVMYYTYTASNLLTDPTVGERLRRLVFRSLRGSRPDTDAGYRAMLNAANALAGASP